MQESNAEIPSEIRDDIEPDGNDNELDDEPMIGMEAEAEEVIASSDVQKPAHEHFQEDTESEEDEYAHDSDFEDMGEKEISLSHSISELAIQKVTSKAIKNRSIIN